MNPIFRFSRASKIVMSSAAAAALFALAFVGVYAHKDVIGTAAGRAAYLVKLPFDIIELVSAPPDSELLMPVYGVEVGGVADTWHAPRSEGRVHEGQDIFAPRGTPVLSATDGYVTFAGENRLGSNVVFVLGAGGRRYYYAHLDALSPEASFLRRVGAGTVLGYVGNTGNAETTPPHLHFGVYGKDGAMDPLPLLRDREN